MRVEASPAAGLVRLGGADNHAFAARYQSLRIGRRASAADADRPCLRDVFRDGQQERHRLERSSEIIHVQAGDDHALALVGQNVRDPDQVLVEELSFINAHYISVNLDRRQNLVGRLDRLRGDPHFGMRNDVLIRITQIDRGLEYLDLLSRDLRPAQTANQFLALAAEHRAGDDFYPTRVARLTFQFSIPFRISFPATGLPPPSTPKCMSAQENGFYLIGLTNMVRFVLREAPA